EPPRADLLEVLWDDLLDRVGEGGMFEVAADPRARRGIEDLPRRGLVLGEGAEVEVWRVVQVACRPVLRHLDVEHPLRDDARLPRPRGASVLDRVLEVEDEPGLLAGVALVDEDGTTAQEVAVALEGEVERRVEEGVTGADEGREGLARRRDQILLVGDPLVALEDRLADPDHPVAVPDQGGDVPDLVAPRLALAHRPPEPLKGLEEERLDVMRLQPPRLGALHLLPDPLDPGDVHGLRYVGAVLEEFLELLPVDRGLDGAVEPGADLGEFAVADRLDQEVAERLPLELQLPEDIEDLPAEGAPGLLELLEEPEVDITLPRLLGDEVPEVADLRLADTVDAAEALLQPVRVPGEVVVDHQVRALEVDPLAGGVGREEDLDLRVVSERLLGLEPIFAPHPAMDHDDRLLPAEEGGDPLVEVVQRVPVLGEDHQLLPRRWLGRGDSGAPVRRPRLGDAVRDRDGGEDLTEEGGEFAPLLVLAATPDLLRERLEPLQDLDLGLEFVDRAGGGRPVEYLLLGRLEFVIRRVLEIFYILHV